VSASSATEAAIAREHKLLTFATAILEVLAPAKKGCTTIEEAVAFQSAYNQGLRTGMEVGKRVAQATNAALIEQQRQEAASAASSAPAYYPGYL
jgi:hypothetical protein